MLLNIKNISVNKLQIENIVFIIYFFKCLAIIIMENVCY